MLTPQQALEKYFGHSSFREGQEEAIQRTINDQHTLLVMPTGSGKSLTYQLPAMLKPGLTLVISPLIALMKDQVDGLIEAGLPATYINSSLPTADVNARMRAVLEGDVKLLYIAPERLGSRQFTQALAKTKVSLLAVDEAHCISQWGHDFRPDYLRIGPTWQAMGRPTLLATTATATPAVQQDILTILGAKKTEALVTGFNRPNLTFQVKHTPDDQTKLQTLEGLLKGIDSSAIVYAATRRKADDVADFIERRLKLPARSYHAGLDQNWRARVQNDFMADRIKIVVATNAFGMGVDKPDVRAVIHYNLPGTVEAYYQESGRAGRDNLPAECVLLYAPDDQRLQEWFITSDTPHYEDLHQIYHLLANAATGEEVHLTQQELVVSSGFHPVKLRVTLNELEQAGLIYHLGSQGNFTSWKILPPSAKALEKRVRAIEKRSEIRYGLLANMLHYAHLMTCRRKFLLDYFGDTGSPEAPRCCDNHTTSNISDLPKATSAQDWYPLIVLDMVRGLQNRAVGRTRLAQILSGSRSKDIHRFGYDQHRFYGKLAHLRQKQIVSLIDELIQTRYLRLEGGKLPVLQITERGLEALTARAVLPVGPLESGSRPSRPSRPHPAQADTVEETLHLHQEGHSPAQIAEQRSLTERTIFNHLTKLIGLGKIDLAEVVPAEIEAQILAAIEQVGSAARLTPIKQRLPEAISFGQIQCAIAAQPDLSTVDPAVTKTKVEQPIDRVVALGKTRDPAHLPELIEALQHENGNVRRLAASALGKIGHTTAVQPLLNLLKTDRKPQVRQEIIKALGKIGDVQARPALEQLVANPVEKDYNISAAESVLAGLAQEASLSPDQVVLETVARLDGILGRSGLAKFLSGSRASWLETFAQHSYFAKLSYLPQKGIMDIIDALITEEKLITTGGLRPKVKLAQTSTEKPQRVPETAPSQAASATSKPLSVSTAIMNLLQDLDGLLTVTGMANLLTANPDKYVPFGDHALHGQFYGKFSAAEVEKEIQQVIQTGQIGVSPHQRVILK